MSIKPTMTTVALKLLTILSIFYHILPSAHGANRNGVKLTRVEVFDYPPILRSNATISRHGSATAVNIDLFFNQDVPQLKITDVLTILSKDGESQTTLYNNTVSLCAFLEQPARNRLLQILRQEIMLRGNIPSKCPIRAGTYSVRNATFAKARIPSLLPPSYFRVDLNLLFAQKMILKSQWYGRFVKV
ncbi:uncharacterized protein LOC118506222 [Anopheles stephensi]|uniref:uncharacterized protein LOC118506222 n=1 Tax=Anopheles stephensi TaxID=30069 RepID=UPI0016589F09|nr:uncharacterized protein LOC118506222 [Anopheles stephensi]